MTGRNRVVVTGMGCVSPLGPDVASSWTRLIAGASAAGPVTVFATEGCRARQAAEAVLPEWDRGSPRKKTRLTRASRLALPAAEEALRQAGLLEAGGGAAQKYLPLFVSTTAGGMARGEAYLQGCLEGSGRAAQFERLNGYQAQKQILDLQAGLDFTGPYFVIANACASGANAIGHAADLIRAGAADCVLAGGFEALTRLVYVGFDCLQALTTEVCRPFDQSRSGLLLGEGAAFLVLESAAHARQRGVEAMAEISGYGHSTDLHHTTQPNPTGEPLLAAMGLALAGSGCKREQIGYLNAHGTATKLNDGAEAGAFAQFFGPDLDGVRISSTKAAIGHTLGAAGALEAIFTVQALRTGQLPPQLNLQQPEPAIANNLVRLDETKKMAAALSVNLGFGGSNAALLFTQAESA